MSEPKPQNIAEAIHHAARVALPLFLLNGWTWGVGDSAFTPTLQDLIKAYTRMATRLRDSDSEYASTGRLVVSWHEDRKAFDFYVQTGYWFE